MTDESHESTEELKDRLAELALGEVLGDQRPPNLVPQIISAAEEHLAQDEPKVSRKESAMKPERKSGTSRGSFVLTASVLLVVGGLVTALLLPATQSAREAARRSSVRNSQRQLGIAINTPTRDSLDSSMQQNLRYAPDPAKQPARDSEYEFGPGVNGHQGIGPGQRGDQYTRIVENRFVAVKNHPLSTFSIDVDTASYANVRQYLMQHHTLPPPDAVRIEELVNYFRYDYPGPTDEVPFACHIEVAGCPWNGAHRLARIGLKGVEVDPQERPASNLVFLLDVSGSMNQPNKLPLLKQGMKLLAEQLGENDRVAIVVYASSEGLVLPSTPGFEKQRIMAALENLQAGGSTNGGAGIELAYRVAEENFIRGGVNRVILCTDGDFNVGTTSTGALERMVEQHAKSGTFLTVLGFGRGNLNDAMMENISNKGNGNYAYIDSPTEARKVLVEQIGGTLVTIAKDVKIQVEFNPSRIAEYRLIGYENRALADEDFNDDTKDAGEIGAGHTVTALYEIVPAGMSTGGANVDPLKYQQPGDLSDAARSSELLTVKLRYKQPRGDTSRLLEFPVQDEDRGFNRASADLQFASAVAAFGMLLRDSAYRGDVTYDAVLEIAQGAQGEDRFGYRAEFLKLIRRARQVAGR